MLRPTAHARMLHYVLFALPAGLSGSWSVESVCTIVCGVDGFVKLLAISQQVHLFVLFVHM